MTKQEIKDYLSEHKTSLPYDMDDHTFDLGAYSLQDTHLERDYTIDETTNLFVIVDEAHTYGCVSLFENDIQTECEYLTFEDCEQLVDMVEMEGKQC